jgi:hypothetical protein
VRDDGDSKEKAMMYYAVTEDRANALDRLNLRDRSRYGLDWMVFYASSARDAVRQWTLYKVGTHPRQADLEAEAAKYRAATAGYAPAWEAEREAIAVDAADRLRAVETEQGVLSNAQADLDVLRKGLQRIAAAAPDPLRPRRRRPSSASPRPEQTGRHRTKAKADTRGPTMNGAPATGRRRKRR